MLQCSCVSLCAGSVCSCCSPYVINKHVSPLGVKRLLRLFVFVGDVLCGSFHSVVLFCCWSTIPLFQLLGSLLLLLLVLLPGPSSSSAGGFIGLLFESQLFFIPTTLSDTTTSFHAAFLIYSITLNLLSPKYSLLVPSLYCNCHI